MRGFFLFLSRRRWLRRWMETSYLGKRMSARFVAGETLERAIAVARRINSESIQVTLDYLGENVSSLEEAAASAMLIWRRFRQSARMGSRPICQ